MEKITISTGHPDAGRVYAEAYEAALAREAALREDLYRSQNPPFNGRFDTWQSACGKARGETESLRQRLNIAEQFVQRLVDCSKGQDSIATGYLSDILDVLRPAEEVSSNG